MFKKGRSRDLEENDLYETLDEHQSSELGDKLEKLIQFKISIISDLYLFKLNKYYCTILILM